jgi:hypothetical protein
MSSKKRAVKVEEVAVEVSRKSDKDSIVLFMDSLLEMIADGVKLTGDHLRGHPSFCNAEKKQESMIQLLELQQSFM